MKQILIFFIVGLSSVAIFGQMEDCTLDMGGKDSELIIKIFQLNDDQIAKMEAWRAELDLKNRVLQDQIQWLFDNHPQSTEEDLINLSKKYNVLQRQIISNSKTYDQMLLGAFNERQYERYTILCNEAMRRPLEVPDNYKSNQPPEE